MQKACNSERESDRLWGPENARKIRLRITDLTAADSLAQVFLLPAARCHELKGGRAGQFAVDVRHPFRLVFEPANDPVPVRDDGGIDLPKVTKVRILDVEDYHGR